MNRTAARSVTVIPPTINPLTHLSRVAVQKRRVAGYARVSTDSDEQFTSYEAQVDYYTHYIKRNPEWEFVKVYTDEGISGTNTKHRIGFNEMIADAMSGKIDLIVTKSVSRFARNTVDSLVTIRKLKEKGVKNVTLMPLMMVAGDHANNDMAGDEEDSHKTILQKEGFKVNTYIHGIGENKNVRSLFVEHANEAWDALVAEK